jgi:drug/metabolite transporter, DME family
VAQDEALSRLKLGFESPWGHKKEPPQWWLFAYVYKDIMKFTSSSYSRGYLIALTATALWSTTGILISYINRTYALPSLVLAFWRDLFVAFGMIVGLAIFSRARFHLPRIHWGFLALYGLTLAIFNTAWTFSVQYNGAAVATVLAFSSPAITAILSRLVFKEEFSRVKILSIVLTSLGVILVSGAINPEMWKLNPLGIIFGLLTGLFFAVYNLEGTHASNLGIDSWTALLYSFGAAAVFLFFFNLGADLWMGKAPLSDLSWLGASLDGWGWLFFLGVAPTLGGFGLYTLSLRYLPPTVTSLIATAEPGLTVIWAYLLFGEVLTAPQLIGSLILFAGMILLRLGEKPNPNEVTEMP